MRLEPWLRIVCHRLKRIALDKTPIQHSLMPSSPVPYVCIGAWNKSSQVRLTIGRVSVEALQSTEYPPTADDDGT